MLRDNVCNPYKADIFYCPEYNRFKLIRKQKDSVTSFVKTTIEYLNYYHFRINLRKTTNKTRIMQYPHLKEERFSLSFNINQFHTLIMDPARGKYCQHSRFTDLRLYYRNYDP